MAYTRWDFTFTEFKSQQKSPRGFTGKALKRQLMKPRVCPTCYDTYSYPQQSGGTSWLRQGSSPGARLICVILVSVYCLQKMWNICESFIQTIDCFSLVRTWDIPTVGAPPDVRPFRVWGGPSSITYPLDFSSEAVLE